MVKKLKYEDFLSELEKFYNNSKDKYSVYLTFKRLYEEKYKYKRSKKCRRMRLEDRKNQDKTKDRFNILIRAKLRKQRIHTIITPNDIEEFHHILTNVLILHFIHDEPQSKKKKEKIDLMKKALSKTQKRKIKKLKKIKSKETKENKNKENNKMEIDKVK